MSRWRRRWSKLWSPPTLVGKDFGWTKANPMRSPSTRLGRSWTIQSPTKIRKRWTPSRTTATSRSRLHLNLKSVEVGVAIWVHAVEHRKSPAISTSDQRQPGSVLPSTIADLITNVVSDLRRQRHGTYGFIWVANVADQPPHSRARTTGRAWMFLGAASVLWPYDRPRRVWTAATPTPNGERHS